MIYSIHQVKGVGVNESYRRHWYYMHGMGSYLEHVLSFYNMACYWWPWINEYLISIFKKIIVDKRLKLWYNKGTKRKGID